MIRLIYFLVIAITSFCAQDFTQAQTVDISEEISISEEDPKAAFDAALKIEERDYKTLSPKFKEHTDNARYSGYLQEAWLRWIRQQANAIKNAPKNQRDEAYRELTKFARNRSAFIQATIKTIDESEKATNNINAGNPSEVIKMAGGMALAAILDALVVADFPVDIHPEEATKNMAQLAASNASQIDLENSVSQLATMYGQSMPDVLDLQTSMPTALHQGDYDKSLKLASKAVTTAKNEFPGKTDMNINALLWMSKLNSTLSDHASAFKFADDALKLIRTKPDASPRKKCLALIFLSRAAFASGKADQGRDALQEAMHIFLSQIDVGYPYTGHDSPFVCGIMSALWEGARYSNLGEFLQAGFDKMSGPAQRLVESPEDRTMIPSEQLTLDAYRVTLILAEMLLFSKDHENAAKVASVVAQSGTDLRGNVQFSRQSSIYLNGLAIKALALKSLGSNKESSELVQKWLENYKARITDTIQGASEQQRMRFATQQRPFDFVATMEDPLAVAEMSFFFKGAVLESLLNQKKVISRAADGELQNQMDQIQMLKSLLQGQGNAQSDAQQKLGEKERDLAENVRRSFKESDILEVLKSSNFRLIPKNLPPDTAFIDFIQFSEFGSLGKAPKRYAAIIINDKGKLTFQKLATVEEVDTLVRDFRALVAQPSDAESDKKLESICRKLHDQLLLPLDAQLKGTKELVVCPDGNLNFIPFGAFLDKKDQFLLQNRTIRYVSSGRDLLRTVSNNPAKEMLILANPDFNGANPAGRETFLPLPGTKKEADAASVAMRDSGFNVQILEQTQAAEDQLKTAKSPRILHIATHGFNLASTHGSDSDPSKRGMKIKAASTEQSSTESSTILPNELNPMFRTGLALSKANDTFSAWIEGKQPPSDNDGILQAGEVPTIDLSGTWIVVLSACQTGEGEAMGGEGVFGLKRGFLQAGANNLLMTLWPIADKETSEMMTDFYRKIAGGSTDPGKSLSEIQRDWITRLRSEHGTTFAINRAAPFILTAQGKISQ